MNVSEKKIRRETLAQKVFFDRRCSLVLMG